MAKTWAETLKANPALLDLPTPKLELEKRKWFRDNVAATPEYKGLPREGRQALISAMMADDTHVKMKEGWAQIAARAQLRADLAKRPGIKPASKRQMISQRLGIEPGKAPDVVSNPIEALGREFNRQYMEDTTGGHAIKAGHRALGNEQPEEDLFIADGPLANVGGFLGGLAAQATSPDNAIPGAKGATVILNEGIKTAAKGAAKAALPAAKLGAAINSLDSGMRQYGETGEVDLGQVAVDTVMGAGFGAALGGGAGVLAAGANRRAPAQAFRAPEPQAAPAVRSDVAGPAPITPDAAPAAGPFRGQDAVKGAPMAQPEAARFDAPVARADVPQAPARLTAEGTVQRTEATTQNAPGPITSEKLRELVTDESGQATPIGLRAGWDAVGNLADQAAGAVTSGIARSVNAVAGHDVLQGGFDPVRLEDRMGRQAVDLVKYVAYDAGKGHPYWGPILKKARWFTLPDANLPPGFVQTRAAREAQSRQQANRLLGKANEYEALTPDERAARYLMQSEEANIPNRDTEGQELAGTIDEISQQMRDVGAIAPGQYDATQNRYAKRVVDPLGGREPIPARLIRRSLKAIEGSESRGRKMTVNASDIGAIGNTFNQVGTAPTGQPLLMESATGEVWMEMGRNGDKVNLWRDHTFDERVAHGEVMDIVPSLRAMAKETQKGLNHGGLLADIAANPDWAVSKADVEAGTVQRPDGWVLVDNKENKSGMPRWGRLANHYVDPDIYEHLVSAYHLNQMFKQMGDKILMPIFKQGKTVFNYASWMNNIMQENVGLTLGGGNPFDVPEALMILRERGSRFQNYEALGLFDNAALAADIGQQAGGSSTLQGALPRLLKMGRDFVQFHRDAYQGIGDVYRLAHVISYERRGMPTEMAIERARSNTYTSDIKSPVMDAAANLAIPFIKASYFVTTKIPEMSLLNPGRAALAIGAWNLYHLAHQAYTGESNEEVAARKELVADHLKSAGGFVPLPGRPGDQLRDSFGQPLILSTKNWLPLSSFDTTSDTAMLEQYPNALMPGGPLWSAAQAYMNRQSFTNQPIVDPARPESDLEQKARFWLAEMGPSTLTYHLPKLEAALQGRPTMSGTRYDPLTAAANVVGVKVQPYDAAVAYDKLGRAFDRKIEDIESSIRREERAYSQGKTSLETKEARKASLVSKRERILAQRQQALKKAAAGVRRAQ